MGVRHRRRGRAGVRTSFYDRERNPRQHNEKEGRPGGHVNGPFRSVRDARGAGRHVDRASSVLLVSVWTLWRPVRGADRFRRCRRPPLYLATCWLLVSGTISVRLRDRARSMMCVRVRFGYEKTLKREIL